MVSGESLHHLGMLGKPRSFSGGQFLYLESRHLKSFPRVILIIEMFISKALWQRGACPVIASERIRQAHSGQGRWFLQPPWLQVSFPSSSSSLPERQYRPAC